MKQKSSSPCKICKGKSKKPCCICGWKGAKKEKQKKEITRDDRRHDFLVDIYNWRRKCNMPNTGMIGTTSDLEIVIIVKDDGGPDLEILDTEGHWLIARELVTNIRLNTADVALVERFGDPTAEGSKPCLRRYKAKKNEV
jgi:hypothetical protein